MTDPDPYTDLFTNDERDDQLVSAVAAAVHDLPRGAMEDEDEAETVLGERFLSGLEGLIVARKLHGPTLADPPGDPEDVATAVLEVGEWLHQVGDVMVNRARRRTRPDDED